MCPSHAEYKEFSQSFLNRCYNCLGSLTMENIDMTHQLDELRHAKTSLLEQVSNLQPGKEGRADSQLQDQYNRLLQQHNHLQARLLHISCLQLIVLLQQPVVLVL